MPNITSELAKTYFDMLQNLSEKLVANGCNYDCYNCDFGAIELYGTYCAIEIVQRALDKYIKWEDCE